MAHVDEAHKDLPADLQLIKNAEAPCEERILAVMQRHHDATEATLLELVGNGGIRVLAEILMAGWPSNGEFHTSPSASDTVVALSPAQHPELLGWGPVSGQGEKALQGKASLLHRSLRRVVVDALADMSKHPSVVLELHASGLFALFHFPTMLSSSIERYIPGQTLGDQTYSPDQGQHIADRLLVLAGRAAAAHHTTARFMVAHCGVAVNKAYKDPWQAKWEPQHKRKALTASAAAAQAARASSGGSTGSSSTGSSTGSRPSRGGSRGAGGARGGGGDPVFPEVVPSGMTAAEIRRAVAEQEMWNSQDGLLAAYGSFMAAVVPAATAEERLRLVEEGDAIAKVSRVIDHPHITMLHSGLNQRLHRAMNLLADAWERQARKLSREMAAARKTGPEARALSMRQSGNGSFKGGDYPSALSAYLSALALVPYDALLYSNIALTHLKMGHVDEAYDAARAGLAHDATNSKVWVRLGDACRDAGRWQLAQLAYSSALALPGGGGDTQVQARHDGACAQLCVAWTWSQVPAPWDMEGKAVWLGLPGKPPGPAAADAWLRRTEKELGKLGHTSRAVACEIKQHWLTACAVLAARRGELARLPAHHEWQMSWSDTPMRAPGTGQIRHMISIADAVQSTGRDPALCPAPSLLEGVPGPADCAAALALACFHPPNGLPPNKPTVLSLGYRMLSVYDELVETISGRWGIDLTIETKTEAMRASVQYDTHYMGRNYEDTGYVRESMFKLKTNAKDPGNDHKPMDKAAAASRAQTSDSGVGSSSGGSGRGSSGGGGGGASKKKKQQRQQQQQQQQQSVAAATAGPAVAAAIQPQLSAAGQQQQQRVVELVEDIDGVHIRAGGGTYTMANRCDAAATAAAAVSAAGPSGVVHHVLTGFSRHQAPAGWVRALEAARCGRCDAADVQYLQQALAALSSSQASEWCGSVTLPPLPAHGAAP